MYDRCKGSICLALRPTIEQWLVARFCGSLHRAYFRLGGEGSGSPS